MAKPIPTLTARQLRRFWAKVDKRGDSECWPWIGCRSPSGYGKITINYGDYRACRVMLAIHGQHDPSLVCCHSCNNPTCVNPKHLRLGDHFANHRDRVVAGTDCKGSRHGSAKLTEADIPEIRELCKILTLREIAEKFGISSHTVEHIKYGHTWKHV